MGEEIFEKGIVVGCGSILVRDLGPTSNQIQLKLSLQNEPGQKPELPDFRWDMYAPVPYRLGDQTIQGSMNLQGKVIEAHDRTARDSYFAGLTALLDAVRKNHRTHVHFLAALDTAYQAYYGLKAKLKIPPEQPLVQGVSVLGEAALYHIDERPTWHTVPERDQIFTIYAGLVAGTYLTLEDPRSRLEEITEILRSEAAKLPPKGEGHSSSPSSEVSA